MTTHCRVCGHPDTDTIEFPCVEPGWRRCRLCGSDSNHGRIDANYDGYESQRASDTKLLGQLRYNLDLFAKFRGLRRSFLDVGACEGTALRHMRSLGWDCHGFDVTRQTDFEPVTLSPSFSAHLFAGRTFDAIMCREVIEHDPQPKRLFGELVACLSPQGILQVQTPRPLMRDSKLPYQTWHCEIIAPDILRQWGVSYGLVAIDVLIYDLGQCWTWQRPG